MAEAFYLIIGFVILLTVSFDFFYTTLSGNGAAFFTSSLQALLHRFQLLLLPIVGRRVFTLSGVFINLGVLVFWVISIWVALFLVFSSDPDAIVHTTNLQAANSTDRLYYTGYVLSTLGNGDFKATKPLFQMLTGIFSFFGFIFFTTSMTYLVSVSSAVIHKRSLAMTIRKLGRTPSEIIKNLFELDPRFFVYQISLLQQMIDHHSVNQHAYPVLHYYANAEEGSSLSINIAALDEAVSMLLCRRKDRRFQKEIGLLRYSLDQFMQHMKVKYNQITESGSTIHINWAELDLPEEIHQHGFGTDETQDLDKRRQVLFSLLKTEGYQWKNVYQTDLDKSNNSKNG
jgi:hypothetical protein